MNPADPVTKIFIIMLIEERSIYSYLKSIVYILGSMFSLSRAEYTPIFVHSAFLVTESHPEMESEQTLKIS